MKRILSICSVLAIILLLPSCNNKVRQLGGVNEESRQETIAFSQEAFDGYRQYGRFCKVGDRLFAAGSRQSNFALYELTDTKSDLKWSAYLTGFALTNWKLYPGDQAVYVLANRVQKWSTEDDSIEALLSVDYGWGCTVEKMQDSFGKDLYTLTFVTENAQTVVLESVSDGFYIGADYCYFSRSAGVVQRLDRKTGEIGEVLSCAGSAEMIFVDEDYMLLNVVQEGEIYVYVYDLKNCDEPVFCRSSYGGLLADGKVYVLADYEKSDKVFYMQCVNLSDGTVQWEIQEPEDMSGGGQLIDGWIYTATTHDGVYYRVSCEDGTLERIG